MAIFEKDRASRRYYLPSTDSLSGIKSTAPGGIPTGSIATYTDKGAKFIYDGQSWTPWAGEEDEELVAVREAVEALLPHLRVIRAATATIANEQSGTQFSTDDE